MAKKQETPEEKIYNIPLRSVWVETRRIARSKKAVSTVKKYIIRHMHAKDVKISQKLNESIWSHGAKKPPARVRVKASIGAEGKASVRLPEELSIDEEKRKVLEKKDEKPAGKEQEVIKEGKAEDAPGKAAEEPKEEHGKHEEHKHGHPDKKPAEK